MIASGQLHHPFIAHGCEDRIGRYREGEDFIRLQTEENAQGHLRSAQGCTARKNCRRSRSVADLHGSQFVFGQLPDLLFGTRHFDQLRRVTEVGLRIVVLFPCQQGRKVMIYTAYAHLLRIGDESPASLFVAHGFYAATPFHFVQSEERLAQGQADRYAHEMPVSSFRAERIDMLERTHQRELATRKPYILIHGYMS